ncbi:hypothetical protein KC675_02035 [Candidatus Dojkabacteria bacterium]|uniref:DUF4134 domain-containing protein n=1 Tax=Candidatus Dojkabacteria bacterium TaxID=2099670 RepID=A0A955L0C6_9BACT|nr:hypothetical protein [Candidatus Dojkabacteria bacterium]
MKNSIISTLFTFSFLMLFPFTINAQGNIPNPAGEAFKDFPTAVATLSSWIRSLAILVYLAMLLYAGYVRMTAGGDPEKAKKAMQIIMYSTTGFILIIIAPLVIRTVGAIFQIEVFEPIN